MQGKNSTRSMQPKSGDGTQDVRVRQDANWFGRSQEPQEEFSTDEIGQGGRHGPLSRSEPETEKAKEVPGNEIDKSK